MSKLSLLVKGLFPSAFLFVLLLKLSEFFSDSFLFRRAAGFSGLAFPLGKVVVIMFHNGFHLAEGSHKYLTFTGSLLTNGAAPKDVQELLGQSDLSTTMNIYAHATRETKRRSARLLDKVVGGE